MRAITVLAAVVVAMGTVVTTPANSAVTGEARAVVAVIDEPVNPYHDWFHAGGPVYGAGAPSSVTPALLAELGIDAEHTIRLTRTGDWQADYDADRAQFEAARDGELYWYEGTNLIVASFDPDDQVQLLPDDDQEAHGTATAGAVLAANPEAVVVHVSPWQSSPPDGEQFVHNLPQVDVVNSSYGWNFGIPFPVHADFSYDGVVTHGKLHFGAAGNYPMPDTWSHAGGPWWLIGVGGYHEGDYEGQEPMAGLVPDFVGDYAQSLPSCGQCEGDVALWHGTSFSSPRAAGTASQVLLGARRAVGHTGGIVAAGLPRPAMVHTDEVTLTNWQIRRALEEAALVPDAHNDNRLPPETAPINQEYPWPQLGWGLLTPEGDVVDQTLAHLGLKGAVTRVKPDEACTFMTANQQTRRLYWDNLVSSQSFGQDDYPYVAC